MNQNKLVDILTSVVPEIVQTKDPEKVLLKTAKAHNMYPTQLEKLGHAFNSMKSLVAMEKQANRGDSFKLLDVQAMVKKYASYDPHKKLSDKDKEVHNIVDNLNKAAGDSYAWLAAYSDSNMNKKASTKVDELLRKQPEDIRGLNALFTMDVESPNANMEYEIKQASAIDTMEDIDRYKDMVVHLNSAESQARALKANTLDDMEQHAVKFANYLRKNGPTCWPEMVEDCFYHFGEKCASAVQAMEEYMELHHVPYYTVDLTKRASAPWLISDRHNCWESMEKVMELKEMHKEASDSLTKINEMRDNARVKIAELKKSASSHPVPSGNAGLPQYATPKPGSGSAKKSPDFKLKYSDMVDAGNKAIDSVKHVAEGILRPQDTAAAIEGEKRKAKDNLALQQLILNDPILQEADQGKVESLYNTIRSIAPTFAGDKNMISTALKEAIQYDAVPINMLKDIAAFEGSLIKNQVELNKL